MQWHKPVCKRLVPVCKDRGMNSAKGIYFPPPQPLSQHVFLWTHSGSYPMHRQKKKMSAVFGTTLRRDINFQTSSTSDYFRGFGAPLIASGSLFSSISDSCFLCAFGAPPLYYVSAAGQFQQETSIADADSVYWFDWIISKKKVFVICVVFLFFFWHSEPTWKKKIALALASTLSCNLVSSKPASNNVTFVREHGTLVNSARDWECE